MFLIIYLLFYIPPSKKLGTKSVALEPPPPELLIVTTPVPPIGLIVIFVPATI
jgi:hypothetical protein